MEQYSLKKSAVYACIIAGSLVTATGNYIASEVEISAKQSTVDLTIVNNLLETTKTVIDDISLVLIKGCPKAYRRIPHIDLTPFTTGFCPTGNPQVDEFVKTTATLLKRVVDFFKAYQDSENYVGFAQEGEKVMSFEKVIELMQTYRIILIEAARKTNNQQLEDHINNVCKYIVIKKKEFDTKVPNKFVAVGNITKAMSSGNSNNTAKRNKR